MPPPLDSYGNRQRDVLRKTENAAAARVVDALRVAAERLEKRILKIWLEIEAAKSRGETVSPAMLFEHGRLSKILAELQKQIDIAALKLGRVTTAAQRKAIRQAERDLLRIADEAEAFTADLGSAFDKKSVEALIGFGGPKSKSPLANMFRRIGEPAARAVENTLVFGMTTGQTNAQIAREIRGIMNTTTAHALTIARTETNNAYREASRKGIAEHGEHFKGWMWLAACDLRTCPICWRQHGTIRATKDKFRTHANCRCTIVPAFNDEANRPPVATGIAKFANLTEAQQKTILGPGRFALYQQGYGLKQMVGHRKTPYGKIPTLVNIGDLAAMKPSGGGQIQAPLTVFDKNIADVAAKLNLPAGKPMAFKKANEGKGNKNFKTGKYEYSINCQVCVVAHELRRRGFDVTALPNKETGVPRRLSTATQEAWRTAAGAVPTKQTAKGTTASKIKKEFESLTKDIGRYHIDWSWKGRKPVGHIITAERLPDGTLRFYDPQTGEITTLDKIADRVKLSRGIRILRVDDLLINSDIVKGVVEGY